MMRALVLVVGVSVACAAPLRARFEMTQAELEQRLSERFPLEKGDALLRLGLYDPEVLLTEGSEEIGVRMQLRVGIGPMSVPAGRLAVAGELSYDADSGTLLLHQPRVHTLELEGPAREKEAEARELVNRIVREVLPVVPLKRLEGGAKWMLKSVAVRDGSVWVEVGL